MKMIVVRSLCVLLLTLAVVVVPLAAQDKVSPTDNPPQTGNAPEGGNVLISQPPNAVNGFFNDAGCAICGSGQQSIADNFVLTAATDVGEVMWWGGYFPSDNFMADAFTVMFHTDGGGVPGTMISSETGTPSATATGVVLFGVSEYEFDLVLSPVALDAGTYWVEIFSDTSANADDVFWETGDQDPTNGIFDAVFSTTVPGSGWLNLGFDMAYVLFESTGVPTMGAMSLALLAAVLLGLSLAVMAHFKKRRV